MKLSKNIKLFIICIVITIQLLPVESFSSKSTSMSISISDTSKACSQSNACATKQYTGKEVIKKVGDLKSLVVMCKRGYALSYFKKKSY